MEKYCVLYFNLIGDKFERSIYANDYFRSVEGLQEFFLDEGGSLFIESLKSTGDNPYAFLIEPINGYSMVECVNVVESLTDDSVLIVENYGNDDYSCCYIAKSNIQGKYVNSLDSNIEGIMFKFRVLYHKNMYVSFYDMRSTNE